MNNSAENPSKFSLSNPLKGIRLPAVIIGLVAAAIALLIGSLALSLIYCHSSLADEICFALRLPLIALICLIGGFAAAKSAGRHGLQQGLKIAAVVIIILAICTTVGSGSPIALALKAVAAIIGGAIGGVLGVF